MEFTEDFMKKIKFSHDYDKLQGMGHTSTLLQVLKVHYTDLSEYMLKYDAKIYGSDELYPVPKGDLILLIFQSDKNMIFTTIRRYTPSKFEYYKNLEGVVFEIC